MVVGRRNRHAALTQTKRDLKKVNYQIIHGKAICKHGITEIAKGGLTGDLQHLLKPPVARTNMQQLVGLWPKTIKLNLS